MKTNAIDSAQHPRSQRAFAAVCASIAGHAVALLVLTTFLPCEGDTEHVSGTFGAVAMVPVDVPEPEPPDDDATVDRQFVSAPEPEEEQVPEEADFHDRFDRTVEQETVARTSPGSTAPHVASADAARRGNEAGEDAPTVARAEPVLPLESGETNDGEGDLAPRLPSPPQATDLGDEDGAQGQGTPDAPSPRGDGLDLTMFNPDVGDPVVMPGGAQDDVLVLEEGDRTMLNSMRSIYWSFFERMKRQIAAEWSPQTVYQRNDPHHVYYRQIDRYTVLDLTLSGDGDLESATVNRSSGLDFLDAEAIRAVRAAAPFRNVPEGLKDARGRVDIRFGFMLAMDHSTRLRRIPTR